MPSESEISEILERFVLLQKLSEEQRVLLAGRLKVRSYGRGQLLKERDAADDTLLFLLDGMVQVESVSGRSQLIRAESEAARHVLNRYLEKHGTIRAFSGVTVFSLSRQVMTSLLKQAPGSGMAETGMTDDDEAPEYAIVSAFYEDLKQQRLELPSLPDLAIKLRRLADQEDIEAKDISRAIMRDPSITAKLIHAANSPLYRGFRQIESCEDAVVRLGLGTTRQLITIFSLRSVFVSRYSVLQRFMSDLWRKSVEIGAIAQVLAGMTSELKAEQAMLAGILHNIGAIPVVKYAEKHVELRTNDSLLADVVSDLASDIGCTLLEAWHFSPALVEVVRHAGDPMYDSGESAAYVDLVVLAKAHAAIREPGQSTWPTMDQMPAFRKLDLGELSPQKSLLVLDQAQEEIASIRDLFY